MSSWHILTSHRALALVDSRREILRSRCLGRYPITEVIEGYNVREVHVK